MQELSLKAPAMMLFKRACQRGLGADALAMIQGIAAGRDGDSVMVDWSSTLARIEALLLDPPTVSSPLAPPAAQLRERLTESDGPTSQAA